MSFKIGGFALDEDAVDGDWETFNYCVAENYYDAMLGEEFELLGYASCSFIENIMYWLNYDGEIGKNHKEDIEKIRTGLFMTCNNRTFIDAIVETKNVSFAQTYINFGSEDVRLFVICLFGVDICIIDGEEQYDGTVLNMINRFCETKDDYIKFLSKMFALLGEQYNELQNDCDRIEFLNVVRTNIKKFKYRCNEKISLNEICNLTFSRKLVNK